MLAIVLMFMQLGFLGAVGDTATLIYQQMPMDVVVRSPDYLHLFEPAAVRSDYRMTLQAVPEVAEVRQLDAGLVNWRNRVTAEPRTMAAIGIDPASPGVITGELQEKLHRLVRPDLVLVDRASRAEFGGLHGKFSQDDVGTSTEVNGRQVRIAETFYLGTGLAATGAMVTSREGFKRLMPEGTHNQTSLFLIRLREGVAPPQGRDAIAAHLASNGLTHLMVLTADQALRAEKGRWYWETPIGMIFLIGVFLAMIVGGLICYMVLASDVIANLPEYATLKAIGYSSPFLAKILLEQAILLASIALVPAMILSLLLYRFTGELAGIEIVMTSSRLVGVSLLSMLMCMFAGVVALKKLTQAEPASLF